MSPEDAWQIQSLAHRYGVAVDTQRFALFEDIFSADAVFDYFGNRWERRDGFINDFATAHAGYDVTQHSMGTHVAELTADGATALTYCHWRLARDGRAYWGTAWYDDNLVRTDRGWRIAARRCELLWWDGDPGVTSIGTAPIPVPLHEYRLRRPPPAPE